MPDSGILARRVKEGGEGRKSPFREFGNTGLKRYHGTLSEEFLRNLKGKRGAKSYREMRDNCAVTGSVFFATEQFIVNNGFDVQPHKSKVPNALMQAEFADQCFDDMEHSRSEFLSEILSTAWQGFGLHQKVFKFRRGNHCLKMFRSKYNDGRVGIRKLPIRSQDTIEEWVWDEYGEVLAVIQQPPPNYKIFKYDIKDMLHFKTTSVKNNPQGRSWLRNAYRSWTLLKRIQEYEAIGISRDMAGVPVGRIPLEYFSAASGSDQEKTFNQAKKVLSRMQAGEQSYVLWPSEIDTGGNTGWGVGLMQSGGRRPMDVDGVIRRYESRILVSMLAEAVLLGQQGNVGSWSLASTQTHMFAVALGGLMKQLADTINRQLLPELAILNGWPPDLAPTVVFADLESEDIVAMLQAVSGAVTSGVMIPDEPMEEFFREKIGLPPKTEQAEISQGQLQDAVGEYQEQANAEDAAMLEEKAAEGPVQYKTAAEVAARWNMSPGTVIRMIRDGKLPAVRFGSRYRIPESSLGDIESSGAVATETKETEEDS